ncbi:MAG: hypothetical protein RMH75_07230 [Archaeoglobaceae archaeon]|nr:hypothetical protein [Archaeoglobaceae archaeon]
MMGVVGTAVAVVVLGVTILIGLVIYGNIATSIPTSGLPPQFANITPTLHSNVAMGFNLLTIGIIVLVASFIIGLLVRMFR